LGTTATAVLRDSLTIKPVLVLGMASWEGKFVLVSLEEYGWKVDARFIISPFANGIVTQGAPPVIDTAHYAAVIALDTSAAQFASSISEFVHNGGGFIAADSAANMSEFSGILPGTTGPLIRNGDFTLDTLKPREALALMPIGRLKPGAVSVEVRNGQTAIAAQRLGKGRVLQVGYLDTWRWRMGGIDDPASLYRGWWSNMVSSVAYAPRTALPVNVTTDQTPMVTLVETLGRPTHVVAEAASFLNDPRLLAVLFSFLMAAFFIEWASRRLRGRP
jgi:hypothetical protein